MTEYKITLNGMHRFGVEITSPDRFLWVRGFAPRELAEAWITEQEFAQAAVDAAAVTSPENDPAALIAGLGTV